MLHNMTGRVWGQSRTGAGERRAWCGELGLREPLCEQRPAGSETSLEPGPREAVQHQRPGPRTVCAQITPRRLGWLECRERGQRGRR